MKRKRRTAMAASNAAETFVRGFVATALLSAIQDRGETTDWRKILRHGVQGGAALTAGTIAAEAVTRRDYGVGAAAVAVGASAILAAEAMLQITQIQENPLGQEEA